MAKITESESLHSDLEKRSTAEILYGINQEDAKVHAAIHTIIPDIERFIEAALQRMQNGGRLFYIGAGTSGRLGIVDASECPPTFGVPHGMVIGIIAGGDTAIRKAVEFAEDDREQGWKDLLDHEICESDTVVGIAASGGTPYVIGAIQIARSKGILTAGITCNPDSPLSKEAEFPLVAIVGPEFVTGSTRMKSGTAQKLILNMISTTLMIKLGRVKGNRMVDMQLSNDKLIDRGTRMVMEGTGLDYQQAGQLLLLQGSVRKAIDYFKTNNSKL
jgi:N-acetylmuramic acid 6-phosphate etherase